MDNLSDSDVASKDLGHDLSKEAGKQQPSLLKCISGETWRRKTVIVHKAHIPTLHSSRKWVKTRKGSSENRTDVSIKLDLAFLLGEQREKSRTVTFSKTDSCTQVWPLASSAFGYDVMVHLPRNQEQSLRHQWSMCVEGKVVAHSTDRTVPSQCDSGGWTPSVVKALGCLRKPSNLQFWSRRFMWMMQQIWGYQIRQLGQ